MSDLVEDFLSRERDGLAGLENEIPSAFDGKELKNILLRFIDLLNDFFLLYSWLIIQPKTATRLEWTTTQMMLQTMHTVHSMEVSLGRSFTDKNKEELAI